MTIYAYTEKMLCDQSNMAGDKVNKIFATANILWAKQVCCLPQTKNISSLASGFA